MDKKIMTRKLGSLIFLLAIAISSLMAGTTYYVDASNGDDNNDGLTESSPWKTIQKVNKWSFSPGDHILFKRGETWREELIVPSSGTSGNPITFGTYGSGTAPVINGSDSVSGAVVSFGNISAWQTSLYTEPSRIYINGALGNKKTKIDDVLSDKDWCWSSGALYVHSAPETIMTSAHPLAEVAKRDRGIRIWQKRYIIIDGLTVKQTKYYGIEVVEDNSEGHHIVIRNVKVSHTGYEGIYVRNNKVLIEGTEVSHTAEEGHTEHSSGIHFVKEIVLNDGEVKNCKVHHVESKSGKGITVSNNSDGIHIHKNTIYDNPASGVKIYGRSDNCLIEKNTIYSNGSGPHESAGINIRSGSHDYPTTGNVVRYNKIYDNSNAGIHLQFADKNKVYYNLLYRNNTGEDSEFGQLHIYDADNNSVYNNVIINGKTAGIKLVGTSSNGCSNNNLKNNISYNNNEPALYVDGTHNGLNLNNNCYYRSSGNVVRYDGATFTKENFASYQSQKGQDGNSIAQDPNFVNPSNPNLQLQSTSPCIEAGTDVGLNKDYQGNPVPSGWGVDIGAHEYQNSTPTPDNPVASFTAYPTEGIPPLEVNFDASASYDLDGSITTYEWDFGDGSTDSGITVTHTYQNRGNYTAKLTVTDNDEQSASNSQEIKVGTPPVALFEAFPSSGNTPLKVEFDASISYDTDGEIVSYKWDFGDGTQGTGKKVFHTYYNYGDHTATLKITDDDALSNATSQKIKVKEKPYPPLDVKVRRVTNRGNSFGYCRVEWRKNPKNFGRHNIVKYKIYRKIRYTDNGAYALIKEVSYRTFKYADRSIEDIKELNLYAYAVSAVDDKNKESELAEAAFLR